MKRTVHADTRNLDWTIRLVWTPVAIRPVGPKQIYEGSASPRGAGAFYALPAGILIFLILVIPVMLVVLPLRYARVLPWTIEAVTYPWGKRGGPATVLRWHVKGRRDDLERVIDAIAAALARGDKRPEVPGATRA